LAKALGEELDALSKVPAKQIIAKREERFLAIGAE
jgi:acetyl-CoA carboxylase carboxyl transferase subunit alpha